MIAATPRGLVSSGEPLVSVIMAVFQGERYILGAVRSVLAQTHKNLEVWIVDDGSTDATARLLATITDPRVHVLRQSNSGAAAARNNGLAHAAGEYIAFLDHDDRWFPQKIATELAVLRSAPNPVGLAYSWYYAVDENDRLLHAYLSTRFSGNVFDALLENDNFLIPSIMLLHRDVIETVGPFANIFHEDHSFALRACRRFPAYPTCRRLVAYRQTQNGKCRSILSNYDTAYREQLNVVDQLASLLTAEEAQRFLETQKRCLLFRFLMYGLNDNAKRLLPEVRLPSDSRSPKNILARLFARSGVNLFPLVRSSVQLTTSLTRQGWWNRQLRAFDGAPQPAAGGSPYLLERDQQQRSALI
jgi:glycosyltransferase involved in cell wall biosynthesis